MAIEKLYREVTYRIRDMLLRTVGLAFEIRRAIQRLEKIKHLLLDSGLNTHSKFTHKSSSISRFSKQYRITEIRDRFCHRYGPKGVSMASFIKSSQ